MKIGDAVEYVNQFGQPQPAILTQVWGEGDTCGVNLVIVSLDESKHDSCGRQIERETSVVHQTSQAAHGRYWRAVGA